MSSVRLQLVWLSVAATIAGFFLPWARLDLVETKTEQQIASSFSRAVSKAFGTGKPKRWNSGYKPKRTSMIPTKVSGVQIPALSNREHAKVAMELVELFTKQKQNLGLKSYAVYVLPGLALLCGMFLSVHGKRQMVRVVIAMLCAAVAAAGCWKLLTTDTRALFAIRTGEGLWL